MMDRFLPSTCRQVSSTSQARQQQKGVQPKGTSPHS